ncbi:MAG: DUF3368 domain-containing protein [Pirellulales bacterium]|nr:DUF3368 domain-containing protein [Pirellulales bacterium]
MAELICDTSTLLALHQIGRLDLLRSLSGNVSIPAAVHQELENGRLLGHDVPDATSLSWMTVRTPTATPTLPNASRLGPGECEVLWLAHETPGSVAVLDDEPARRTAAALGIACSGTLGLLIDAKRHGLVAVVAPLLDDLQRNNFHVSRQLRDVVLRAAGE